MHKWLLQLYSQLCFLSGISLVSKNAAIHTTKSCANSFYSFNYTKTQWVSNFKTKHKEFTSFLSFYLQKYGAVKDY